MAEASQPTKAQELYNLREEVFVLRRAIPKAISNMLFEEQKQFENNLKTATFNIEQDVNLEEIFRNSKLHEVHRSLQNIKQPVDSFQENLKVLTRVEALVDCMKLLPQK